MIHVLLGCHWLARPVRFSYVLATLEWPKSATIYNQRHIAEKHENTTTFIGSNTDPKLILYYASHNSILLLSIINQDLNAYFLALK